MERIQQLAGSMKDLYKKLIHGENEVAKLDEES